MVETITPVVHGGDRRRWAASVLVHAAGATLSAAGFGAILGAVGGLLGAPWGAAGLLAVAAVAALYAAREALGLPVPVPEGRRQVPDWWRTFYSPAVSAFLYGLGLGVGFFTYLQFGTLVAVAAGAVVTGSPWWGAAMLGPFGLVRGLTVLVAREVRDERRAGALLDALIAMALRRWPRTLNVSAMLLVAGVAASAAVRSGNAEIGGVAAGVLAITFAWSTLGKVVRPGVWRRALEGYRLPAPLGTASFAGVPLAEAGVVTLAAAGHQRTAGAAALALLTAFSLAIVRARAVRGDLVPCGCFGSERSQTVNTMLVRNALLGVGAIVAVLDGRAVGELGLSPPAGREILPAVLAVLGVAAVVWAGRQTTTALRRSESP